MPTLNLSGAMRLLVLVAVFVAGVWSQSSGVIDDFIFYLPDIQYLAVQHLWLTTVSGSLAILVAIPLGILLSRPSMAKVAESAMQVLNVGTTIPTLAVLALSMSFLGIGTVPAIFGLFVAVGIMAAWLFSMSHVPALITALHRWPNPRDADRR